MTKIMKCKCVHEFQDSRYGQGMRVWNVRGNKQGWRCTVCSAVAAF